MRLLFEQFGRLWTRLSPAQRLTLSLAAGGVLVAMILIGIWSHRTDMKLLYGRLGEREAAEVVTALEAQGIKYQLGQAGGSIYVAADQVHRVRMDLAAKGLPGGEGVGFEIFDRSNFGISDFVQRTNFARALQGELARTISQVKGVRSARVMVVMPENRLLLKTADTRPTASVFVEVGTATLGPEAVNSIRSLVANAVEGLRVDDVAVIDSKGNVLSEELRSDPLLGSASSQIKFRKQVEDYLSNKVETMLAKVLGPGNAVVRVSAEIDSASMTSVEEKFDPESQVARSETTTDDSTITSERNADPKAAGVTSNVPDADNGAAESATGKSTEENRKNKTQIYEINKVTTNTQKSPGGISRVSAAVFVAQKAKDKAADGAAPSRTPEELESLRLMVANALGIQTTTPDEIARIVSLQEVNFSEGPENVVPITDRVASYFDMFQPLLAVGLAVGIFVYFVKMVRGAKSSGSTFEVLEPSGVELLEHQKEAEEREVISPEMLNDLIQQKPDNVAAALRGWLAHKEKKTA